MSLPKTGTHLIGELLKALGYKMYGPTNPDGFGELLTPEIQETLATAPHLLPPDTCLVYHTLELASIPNELALQWHRTGIPAILFNYRDPRDVICSYVRFLTRDTHGKSFLATPTQLAHSAILSSIEDQDERLMHAICDTTFPAHHAFESSTWLLHHPMVLNVTFERLVGAAGGGSDEVQLEQIAAIMEHVKIRDDPARYAGKIFRRDTPVFSRGQIGAWRHELKPQHLEAFNERFGHLLEPYGYERVEP